MKILRLQSNCIHETNSSCEDCTKNKKITFKFMCGFELLQKPILVKNENTKSCITNVLNIDPEICNNKVCTFS